jgi:hypothetical protein
MVRAAKLHLALMNLNGEISSNELLGYFDKAVALRTLRNVTGQDFGYDVGAWRKWINENRPGELPVEKRENADSLHTLHPSDNSEYALESAYQDYLTNNLEFNAAEKLVAVLEQSGLKAESHALEKYLAQGSGTRYVVNKWGDRSCTVGLDLPSEAEPGELWFDPVELNFSILIPNPVGISHHVKSWVSTHPVYVWQYRAFLSLVEINKKLDNFPVPSDYLRANRTRSQDSLSYVTNIYHDEAVAYSSWMRKSLCGQSNLESIKAYLNQKELSSILPQALKLWESGEFQEDYFVAVGRNSINKNPSLDYDAITEENYEKLERLPDRMLYEEWDFRDNISMLTVVSVFLGIDQEGPAESFHYEFENISPRPIPSVIS